MSKRMSLVDVKSLNRRDGGLYVYSDALPELILSGPNTDEVCAWIESAMRTIFAQHGHTVTAITASKRIVSTMELPSLRNLDFKVDHQSTAELLIAA
jgi:hypothetical protein